MYQKLESCDLASKVLHGIFQLHSYRVARSLVNGSGTENHEGFVQSRRDKPGSLFVNHSLEHPFENQLLWLHFTAGFWILGRSVPRLIVAASDGGLSVGPTFYCTNSKVQHF